MEKIMLNQQYRDGGYYLADRDRYDVYESDAVEGTKVHGVGEKIAFYVRGRKNVVLDFNGATVILHGKIQPFFFEECENIKIRNCIVKYDRSAVTEGEILEVGQDYMRLRLNPEHTCRIENGDLIPYGETWENHNLYKYLMFITAIDTETRQGVAGALGVIGREPQVDHSLPYANGAMELSARKDGEDVILEGCNIPGFYKVGYTVVLSHEPRVVSSIATLDCADVFIENYRIINGIGMGILPVHTKNIYIDRLIMTYDELSSGLTTNGADGIHSFACAGNFVIKNSILEGMVDDAINVHSQFYTFESSEGDRMILRCAGPEDTSVRIFGAGDTIRVYRGSTMEGTADYVIRGVDVLDKKLIEVTVDRPVEAHAKNDAVDNLTACCDLVVQDCQIGKSPVSHIRFQSGGKAVMENCDSDFQVMLTGDMSYWYESHPVEELIVRNCRFHRDHANIDLTPQFFATEKEPYYHRVIQVTDCEFVSDRPLIARYAERVEFKRNVNSAGKPMTVNLTNCGDAETENCTEERATEHRTSLAFN